MPQPFDKNNRLACTKHNSEHIQSDLPNKEISQLLLLTKICYNIRENTILSMIQASTEYLKHIKQQFRKKKQSGCQDHTSYTPAIKLRVPLS